MNRIEVSSSATGPANYTLLTNPVDYDPVDELYSDNLQVLHGASVYQKKPFDDRTRTLFWSGNPVSDVNVSGLVTYFRSIEGEIRYFNFKDLDTINLRWDTTNATDADWKKARVITVRTKARRGGSLIYDYVELKLQPEL